jgi:hypothetical protein
MDLDPDKVTNNMDEAALQAELMKDFRAPQQEQAQPQPPAGVDPSDPTGSGGGTIGTGIAPTPQEQGFTGRSQVGQQQPQADTQPTQDVGEQPQINQPLQ